MSDIGDMMGLGISVLIGMVFLGGLVVGALLFFGGHAIDGAIQTKKSGSAACAPAASKDIEGYCHCKTASGWERAG